MALGAPAIGGHLRPVTPSGLLAVRLGRLRVLGVDLARALAVELRAAHRLAAGLEPYVARCTSPESPVLAALAQRTREHEWDTRDGAVVDVEAEMLSGHVEGTTLRFLVAMSGARRVLELGMFSGYSALAMAEALPADGRLVACELDPGVAAFAQEAFDESPAGTLIDVRVGPAADTLTALAAAHERFDFVFIDADKAGYLGYLTTILDEELLAEGGTICVDNTLLQGEPWTTETPSANGAAIAEFNSAVARDPRVEQVLLPVRDGMTLIRRVQ